MTDRIRSEFERWATGREFPDLTQSMGRYNRAVVRWMWEAWQEQAERITDMGTALNRVHARNATLANQTRQLSETISRLSAEGQDAVEM